MAPKLRDRPIVMIEQGETAEAACDAIDGMIDRMTKTGVFSHYKLNPCLEVATDHDLHRKRTDIDVYTEFEMLKVRVPIIFLGTVGFSPRRDRR